MGTSAIALHWGPVTDDSKRFRDRAKDCRRLALDAHSKMDRDTLTDMAVELDAEAARLEAAETKDG